MLADKVRENHTKFINRPPSCHLINTAMGGLTHMQLVFLRRMILVRLVKRYSSDKQSIPIGGADITITQWTLTK
jgi:hypothetical protein